MDFSTLTPLQGFRLGLAIVAVVALFGVAMDPARSAMRRVLAGAVACAMAYALAVAFKLPVPFASRSEGAQTVVKVLPVDSRPDCAITMRALFQAYENNELAAQQKVDGCRSISIKGTVGGVTKMWGSVFVEMETGNIFLNGQLEMEASAYDRVARLNRGNVVVVSCDRMSRGVFGAPGGSGCIFDVQSKENVRVLGN